MDASRIGGSPVPVHSSICEPGTPWSRPISGDPETRIFELEAQVDLQAQEMAAQAREIERLNALLAQIKVAASSSDVVPKAEDDDL